MNNTIKKLVVKIGTSSLTYPNGKLNLRQIKKLTEVCTNIQSSGVEVIVVSSGAIGAGVGKLGLSQKPTELKMKQATAAIGQAFLIQLYQKYFSEYGQLCAQVLLTKDVLTNEIQRKNVIQTLETLHSLGVIPIINENDAISTDEIDGKQFSDNDNLSSIVSVITNADMLVILSDIDGLYKSENGVLTKEIVPVVTEFDDIIKSYISSSRSKLGNGGMNTKLESVKYAVDNNIDAVICNSQKMDLIYDCVEKKRNGKYTYFSKEVQS
mgnify:CR=1 FL=1|jgi:glutamate 5-kinase